MESLIAVPVAKLWILSFYEFLRVAYLGLALAPIAILCHRISLREWCPARPDNYIKRDVITSPSKVYFHLKKYEQSGVHSDFINLIAEFPLGSIPRMQCEIASICFNLIYSWVVLSSWGRFLCGEKAPHRSCSESCNYSKDWVELLDRQDFQKGILTWTQFRSVFLIASLFL